MRCCSACITGMFSARTLLDPILNRVESRGLHLTRYNVYRLHTSLAAVVPGAGDYVYRCDLVRAVGAASFGGVLLRNESLVRAQYRERLVRVQQLEAHRENLGDNLKKYWRWRRRAVDEPTNDVVAIRDLPDVWAPRAIPLVYYIIQLDKVFTPLLGYTDGNGAYILRYRYESTRRDLVKKFDEDIGRLLVRFSGRQVFQCAECDSASNNNNSVFMTRYNSRCQRRLPLHYLVTHHVSAHSGSDVMSYRVKCSF